MIFVKILLITNYQNQPYAEYFMKIISPAKICRKVVCKVPLLIEKEINEIQQKMLCIFC